MSTSNSRLDFLDPPSQTGELGTLGHYRVIDQLGKGGMGYVFRAEDIRLQRTVALKVMNKKIAATPNSRARFISEARAMAAVHHDNVATIFEVGEHNATPYMAMEMLKGTTFEKYKLKDVQRPDYQEIIEFAKQMARGLAAAHAQGIVHRDIKPANMWIEEESNRIKILDFGLALNSTPVDQLAGRGAVIGTPGYLSPEQARSEPLDDRSDLYSMGVVLYELATGQLPLQSKSVAGQLIAILAHSPTPIRELNPEIPEPLANLIHKLLRKEARNRIVSAAALELELDEVVEACEASSDVAQAINSLQMGLDQIVGGKQAPDLSSVDLVPAMLPDMPDPFASLPDGPMSKSTPAASPAIAAPSPYRKKRPSKPAPQPSPLQKYWPAILIGGVAAAAIAGLLVFVLSGPNGSEPIASGRPTETGSNSVANGTPDKPNNGQPSAPTNNRAENKKKGNKKTGNNKKWADKPIPVEALEIANAFVPGAFTLIGRDKANGSFEETTVRSGSMPLIGSGQTKTRIPSWSGTLKGTRAGVSDQESIGVTDGLNCLFAEQKSGVEYTSDSLVYETKPGDVFRLTVDVGSIPVDDGKWKGKTKYILILGFRKPSGKDGVSKWRLAEVLDQTEAAKGMKTIGYQYTAADVDVGNRPYVRLAMSEGHGRRRISFLDNVRLTVESPSSIASSPVQPTTPMPTSVAATAPRVETPTVPEPMAPPPESAPTDPALSNPAPSDPAPSATSNTAPMDWVHISTVDGRGVDSTVKKGGGDREPLGLKPSLAVQTRGEVEIQHIYLRFEIATLSKKDGGKNKKKKDRPQRSTGEASLTLTVSDGRPPKGGSLRVFGISNEAAEVWAEVGPRAITWNNSVSKHGLDALPLLAELNLVPGQRVVTIESPELSEFIRTADRDMVTFVITGRSDGNQPVQFVSRDGDRTNAPVLNVQVLAE